MQYSLIKTLIAAALLLPALAFGLQEDQLRGRVVEVNEDARTITLKILEVGEDLDYKKDVVHVFPVPEEANVEGLLSTDIMASLGDIEKDDMVRVEFDPAEPNVFISIWHIVE